MAACCLPQPVVGAAGNELSINLDLGKGKVVKREQRGPFRREIVNRNGDVAETELSRHGLRQVWVADDVGGINLNDKPFECRMIRHLAAQFSDRFRVLKKREWQVDGDLDTSVLGNEAPPVLNCPANYEIR